jgi:hypothetical protein
MAKGRVAARAFDINIEGQPHSFAAGERVPQEVADEVTNEKVWTPRPEDVEALANMRRLNHTITDDYFEEYGAVDEPEEEDEEGDEVELIDQFSDLTVAQLKEYAQENNLDVSGLGRREEFLSAVRAGENG